MRTSFWTRLRTKEIFQVGNKGIQFETTTTGVYYRDGDHRVFVPVYSRDSPAVIYMKGVCRWNAPHSDEEITPQGREDIAKLVGDYLVSEKLPYRVDWVTEVASNRQRQT
jgi:hypothetical protein